VLFGAATPLSKLLLGTVDPQLLAGMLYLGAGLGLAGVHFGRAAVNIPAPEAPLRASDVLWLLAVVLFGGVAGPLLLMLGLARTEAVNGSLLLNVEGLATMAIAWMAFRENLDRRLLLGAMATVAGAVVLSWEGHGIKIDMGAALIVGACLAWGIDNNLTRLRRPSLARTYRGHARVGGSQRIRSPTMGFPATVRIAEKIEAVSCKAGGQDQRLGCDGNPCPAALGRRHPLVELSTRLGLFAIPTNWSLNYGQQDGPRDR